MCFYELDSLKIEKEKAMLRYLRFNKIGNIFRTLEFFFAILFFSWSICRTSPYFSAVFRLTGVFLGRLSTLVVNHHFVFLLGNGIIFALFIKFGQFACDDQIADAGNSSADEDYQIGEVVPPYHVSPPAVTVTEEKRIIPAEKEVAVVEEEEEKKDFPIVKRDPKAKRYRRSRSDVFELKETEKIKLRRSETEPRRSSVKEAAPAGRTSDVDSLSNEDFRREIEAVIERHRRSLREESLFIVSA